MGQHDKPTPQTPPRPFHHHPVMFEQLSYKTPYLLKLRSAAPW